MLTLYHECFLYSEAPVVPRSGKGCLELELSLSLLLGGRQRTRAARYMLLCNCQGQISSSTAVLDFAPRIDRWILVAGVKRSQPCLIMAAEVGSGETL